MPPSPHRRGEALEHFNPIWPRELVRREATVKANFAPGLHVPSGQAANVSAYDRWVGRWSRPFVPAVISAAEVMPGSRVLDVSTGTGEAALMALPAVGPSGVVIGADIAPAMLEGARDRLKRDFGIDPLLRGDGVGLGSSVVTSLIISCHGSSAVNQPQGESICRRP
jgi:SAM-dependent methyltransferase